MNGQTDESDQEPPMKVMREKRDDAVVDTISRVLNSTLSEYRKEVGQLEAQAEVLTYQRNKYIDQLDTLRGKLRELIG